MAGGVRTSSDPFLSFDGWSWSHTGACARLRFSQSKGGASPVHSFCWSVGLPSLRAKVRAVGPAAALAAPGVGQALAGLGLAVLPWVWMGIRATTIRVPCISLSLSQQELWEGVFRHAAGEFLWENRSECAGSIIPGAEVPNLGALQVSDPLSYVTFEWGGKAAPELPRATGNECNDSEPSVLVPFGGGKDTAVLVERLRRNGVRPDFLFVESEMGEFQKNWRYRACCEAAQCGDCDVAHVAFTDEAKWWRKRLGDPDRAGFAWAAIVCFTASLDAVLRGHRFVIVGNESSAGEGNGVRFAGPRAGELNHQHDKAAAFEIAVRAYLKEYVLADLEYFSGLGDLTEVAIGARFCSPECSRYRNNFFSCNEPVHTVDGKEEWCGSCPKCLFVFLLLAAHGEEHCLPFVDTYHPFKTERLFPALDHLCAPRDAGVPKPMDCVGSSEEACLCLWMAAERRRKEGAKLEPYLRNHRATLAGAANTGLLEPGPRPDHWPQWFS